MKTKTCKNCNIEFNITTNNRKNIFCSHKCSAEFNNKIRKPMSDEQKLKISESLKKRRLENPWLFPNGKEHSKRIGRTTKNKYKGDINSILDVSKRTTVKILKRLDLGCCICGWKDGSCDIHHINGKKITNPNSHSNLTYLCPNHHRLAHDNKLRNEEMTSLDVFLPKNWKEFYFG